MNVGVVVLDEMAAGQWEAGSLGIQSKGQRTSKELMAGQVWPKTSTELTESGVRKDGCQ